MKRIRKSIISCIVLLLVASLLVAAWPSLTRLLSDLLSPGAHIVDTTRLTHELAEVGILTSLQYTDTGVFVSTVPAWLLGDVQRVTVPYRYRIDFGVDLEKATIEAVDDGLLAVSLPQAQMVLDTLDVDGEIRVDDFLYPLTESRYQQILTEQAAALRQAYLDDPSHLTAARETAAAKVRALLEALLSAQGLSEQWSITFV